MTEIEGAVAQFLQSLSKTDSIDLDNIIKYISMTREEREIIESHPFKIWQGNNQKWYTYVPDEEKGRRLVKRATEQKLMMAVISYYRDKEETRSEQKQLNVQKSVEAKYSSEPAEPTLAKKLAQPEPEHVGMTLRELYLEWREYKALHTNAMSYIAKIANDWFRYYEEDEIAQKDLAELDSKYLDYWLHSCIKRLSLTKKQYFSMSIILRQGLEYACNQGYLTENPILKVKVNSKMLHRPPRKPDSKQVFLVDEQSKVQEVAYRLYQERGDPIWLAIPLTFQLGVRVGELSAFKSTDIEGDYIHIQRMERREYVMLPDGRCKLADPITVDTTKTDAGERRTYLTSTSKEILEKILTKNEELGEYCDDFLFVRKGVRVHGQMISKRLYRCCKAAGISKKSMHKIRKTYISTLLDNGVNITTVMNQVGHKHQQTTLENYCFSRFDEQQTQQQLEQVLTGKQNGNKSNQSCRGNVIAFRIPGRASN